MRGIWHSELPSNGSLMPASQPGQKTFIAGQPCLESMSYRRSLAQAQRSYLSRERASLSERCYEHSSQGSLEQLALEEPQRPQTEPAPSRGGRSSGLLRRVTYAGALASLLAASPAKGACQYDVTIIQAPDCPPFGPQWTYGSGVNQNGDVAGYRCVCLCNNDQAFNWTVVTGLVDLELPSDVDSSRAFDLNDIGWIVGDYNVFPSGFSDLAFVHDGKQFINLGTLPGGNQSQAVAVNNSGQVVGYWGNNVTGPLPLAFLWQNGEMIDISADLGTPTSRANDINDNGQATGWMGSNLLNDGNPFIWQNGGVTALPLLPGGYKGEGYGINNGAHVAGEVRLGDPGDVYSIHAVVWIDTLPTDLGTLPGFERSQAVAINDTDVIVGRSWYSDGNPNISRATVWKNGTITDLESLIPPNLDLALHDAWGINNAGQIGASGISSGVVAVLLTPHPQPLGDLNGDCSVDIVDFLTLLSAWGPCPQTGSCPADLDSNGSVDIVDFLTLLSNWG